MYFIYLLFMSFCMSIMYEYSGLNGINLLNIIFSFLLFMLINTLISNAKKNYKLRIGIFAGIIALLSVCNSIKVRFQLAEISFFDLKLAKAAGDIAGLFLDKLPYMQIAIILLGLVLSLFVGNIIPSIIERYKLNKPIAVQSNIEEKLEKLDSVFYFKPIKIISFGIFLLFFIFTASLSNAMPISSFGNLLLSGKSMALNYTKQFEDKKSVENSLISNIQKDSLSKLDNKDPLLSGYPFNKQNDMDVVIIQSETFFDLPKYADKLEKNGIKLEDDTITKEFRNYQKDGISGNLYVPTVGGGTVNTEYEVLTGYGAKYFAKGSIVFTSVLKSNTDSLARYMKDTMPNTSTIAIHNHNADYWDRDRVYPLLGIDKFVDMTMFTKAQQDDLVGAWMSDKTIFDMSKKQLEENPEKNKFLLSVTVQNHGPFLGFRGKYLSANPLSKHDAWEINNYITNLKESDIQLKSFMDYINSRKKPTMVVFYGDHKPDPNYDIFKNSKYYTQNNNLNMFDTDYFFYFNNAVTDSKLLALKGKQANISSSAMNRYIQMLLGDVSPVSMYIYNYSKNPKNYFNNNVISGAQDSLYRQLSLEFINNMLNAAPPKK